MKSSDFQMYDSTVRHLGIVSIVRSNHPKSLDFQCTDLGHPAWFCKNHGRSHTVLKLHPQDEGRGGGAYATSPTLECIAPGKRGGWSTTPTWFCDIGRRYTPRIFSPGVMERNGAYIQWPGLFVHCPREKEWMFHSSQHSSKRLKEDAQM